MRATGHFISPRSCWIEVKTRIVPSPRVLNRRLFPLDCFTGGGFKKQPSSTSRQPGSRNRHLRRQGPASASCRASLAGAAAWYGVVSGQWIGRPCGRSRRPTLPTVNERTVWPSRASGDRAERTSEIILGDVRASPRNTAGYYGGKTWRAR